MTLGPFPRSTTPPVDEDGVPVPNTTLPPPPDAAAELTSVCWRLNGRNLDRYGRGNFTNTHIERMVTIWDEWIGISRLNTFDSGFPGVERVGAYRWQGAAENFEEATRIYPPYPSTICARSSFKPTT